MAYAKPVCKGAWALGTACGHCERCQETKAAWVALGRPGPGEAPPPGDPSLLPDPAFASTPAPVVGRLQAASACCEGERCFCGAPVSAKVEETIFFDDWSMRDDGPNGGLPREMRGRHPLTAYVCADHFAQIMGLAGQAAPKPSRNRGTDMSRYPHYIANARDEHRPAVIRAATRDERQTAVFDWCHRAFGTTVSVDDLAERGRRFLEEAIELFQANGGTVEELIKVSGIVFGRPVGEVHQEIGGVMVTLYALAEVLGLSVEECEVAEIDRVLSKPIEHFQARQREKREMGL